MLLSEAFLFLQLTKRTIMCRIQEDINKISPLTVLLSHSSSYKWAAATEDPPPPNTTTNWILNTREEDGGAAAPRPNLHRTNCGC